MKVVFGLNLLKCFGCSGFFVRATGKLNLSVPRVQGLVLPLTVSFCAFRRVDCLTKVFARGKGARDFLQCFLFIVFFPRLVTNPVMGPRRVVPRFEQLGFKLGTQGLSLNVAVFTVNLFGGTIVTSSVTNCSAPMFLFTSGNNTIDFFLT